MSTSQFLALIGLAIGAIWALTESFGWAVLAGFLTALFYVVGLVLEGRLDLGQLSGGSRDRGRL
jgi:uncharacterized membrane protein YhfC